jgi:hypothetical protein
MVCKSQLSASIFTDQVITSCQLQYWLLHPVLPHVKRTLGTVNMTCKHGFTGRCKRHIYWTRHSSLTS